MEENHRSAVLEWLNNGADYNQGTALYSRIGKNRNMVALFPGKKLRYGLKLRYELCKAAGLDWRNFNGDNPSVDLVSADGLGSSIPGAMAGGVDGGMFSPGVAVSSLPGSFSASSAFSSVSSFSSPSLDNEAYPSIVRRVIHEYGEAYRQRGQLHYRMCDVRQDNQPQHVLVRKELLSQIKALSARMEVLHQAKEDFIKRRVLPDPAVLWPPDKPVTDPVDPTLPDDPVSLRRMKKNLQTANVKDQHLLDYQGLNRQAVKTPMPPGPKRMMVEKRIRGRMASIEKISLKLAAL